MRPPHLTFNCSRYAALVKVMSDVPGQLWHHEMIVSQRQSRVYLALLLIKTWELGMRMHRKHSHTMHAQTHSFEAWLTWADIRCGDKPPVSGEGNGIHDWFGLHDTLIGGILDIQLWLDRAYTTRWRDCVVEARFFRGPKWPYRH